MFLKNTVLFSFVLVISIVNVNANNLGSQQTSRSYMTEFTPTTPLPMTPNPAHSKICTGGILYQQLSMYTYMNGGIGGGGGNGGGNGMGGRPSFTVAFTATTRLTYNDPTGVNNAICRKIPLSAKLVFETMAVTDNGNPTRIDPGKNAAYARAVSNVSSVRIVASYRVYSQRRNKILCLKTSHLSNAGGIVLLKNRKICDTFR